MATTEITKSPDTVMRDLDRIQERRLKKENVKSKNSYHKADDSSSKHVSWQIESSDIGGSEKTIPSSKDLIICTGSPDTLGNGFREASDLIVSAELSQEHRIGSDYADGLSSKVEKSPEEQASNKATSLEGPIILSSTIDLQGNYYPARNENAEGIFEQIDADWQGKPFSLGGEVTATETTSDNQTSNEVEFPEGLHNHSARGGEFHGTPLHILSINVGGIHGKTVAGGTVFQEDNFFRGGDVITADSRNGEAPDLELYHSARCGDFSYHFPEMKSGVYLVDLHLAELVFVEGPPGVRVFDVFIQEKKVLSSVDIYAEMGSNKPLVLPNLEASVDSTGGLVISFHGVNGLPIVCGISIREKPCVVRRLLRQGVPNIASVTDRITHGSEPGEQQLAKDITVARTCIIHDEEDCNDFSSETEAWNIKTDISLLRKEHTELERVMEQLRRENELKSKECTEAWTSLHELQHELMRKSMHVGSLACAVEDQVKEKSRWFSSLEDLFDKFKILKVEHQRLSQEALECKKYLDDVNSMSKAIQSRLHNQADLEKQHQELKVKYVEGAKERKELYNKVLELKGNIRVFCRCRPLNPQEVDEGACMAIDFESAKEGELSVKCNGGPRKVFKFDAVFCPLADQATVFEGTAPFAASVLDGYNVCIFAYGQTGTGKTFTMEGTEEARGVNYRTLEELFKIIDERKGVFHYEISVSVLEVYNEQIRDLLLSDPQPGAATKRLEVRQVAEGLHHVPGLVEANVHNMNEVWDVLQTGSNARAVGSTNANEHSSRSHCIHCVMVKGHNLVNEEMTRSKLWLVDLAGSERITKTEVHGERLKEAQNINRSLSALGDVISALSNKNPHIPFRNSKLTHLLQDSLGGDSKTLMFVQISPNENDMSETLCSLNFASRVRGVELGPAKKQVDATELLRYKQMAEKLKQDMRCKDDQVKKQEENINSLEVKLRVRDASNRGLQDKVKELESQLLIERRLARQHVDTKIAEQQQQQQQQQQHSPTSKPALGLRQQLGTIKDLVNAIRPLTEYNSNRNALPPISGSLLKSKYPMKENNKPEATDETIMTRRTGRASICTTGRRVTVTPVAPRRNSFATLPTTMTPLPPPLRPTGMMLPPPLPRLLQAANLTRKTGEGVENGVEPWGSELGNRSTRTSSILRRSIQKKVYIKSPLPPQQNRRTSALAGMERVRVSFGSQGRLTQRVLASNSSCKTDRHQQLQQKEKERGWNHGNIKCML